MLNIWSFGCGLKHKKEVKEVNQDRLEAIEEYLENIDHALQLYSDPYDIRDVVARQLEWIKDEIKSIRKESTY